jgi:para-aminobenzoate synthetase/4-amino-4-deoxychorismate lyase
VAPPDSGEPRATFNVAIRTVVLDTRTRIAEYGVGGGVTYDSSAAGEYEEVLAKARLLTAARPAFRLLETLAHTPGEGFHHLDEHLERLGASSEYFGFAFERERALIALEVAVRGRADPVRVRLELSRDGSLTTNVDDLPNPPAAAVRVALDDEPVDPSDVWLFHKTTRRAPYERRRERRPDVDDVLLVNGNGQVTESTIANLAVRIDDRWVTPPVEVGLLPGTYRAILVRDGTLTERAVTAQEVGTAEELALVSSVRGWRPAELVP